MSFLSPNLNFIKDLFISELSFLRAFRQLIRGFFEDYCTGELWIVSRTQRSDFFNDVYAIKCRINQEPNNDDFCQEDTLYVIVHRTLGH